MCVTFPVIFQVSLLVSDWQVYYYLHQWLILRKHFYWWFLYFNFNVYWQGFTSVTSWRTVVLLARLTSKANYQ